MRDNNIMMSMRTVAGGDYNILYTKRSGGGVMEWSGNTEGGGERFYYVFGCVYTQHALIKQ